ncbi:MAG: Hsp20 family protein [Xanthomonadales bacterium]|nr:Hsp20 family protein [Xanthomonadales bacterium]NIN58916.1 Hsp20 family protein [Xanthomonadales bacterium]NIN74185.1 Hsp20 family protein [Xanthomonadales bacterium]NIO13856.1 Hsp20 family protein [Xanthomonadales bacterium]NIP11309.1 Hsp20 family protein [Xanthomonadales bacterium]
MNIMRYRPLKEFEDLFAGWPWPRYEGALEPMTRADWSPSVDISETDEEYLIKVEIPEVKKEDLHVQVDKGMLTISGERRLEKEDKKRHRSERFYGHFERSFTLPDNVREDKIGAEQKDGMLYLHLGKSKVEEPKRLEIQIK